MRSIQSEDKNTRRLSLLRWRDKCRSSRTNGLRGINIPHKHKKKRKTFIVSIAIKHFKDLAYKNWN